MRRWPIANPPSEKSPTPANSGGPCGGLLRPTTRQGTSPRADVRPPRVQPHVTIWRRWLVRSLDVANVVAKKPEAHDPPAVAGKVRWCVVQGPEMKDQDITRRQRPEPQPVAFGRLVDIFERPVAAGATVERSAGLEQPWHVKLAGQVAAGQKAGADRCLDPIQRHPDAGGLFAFRDVVRLVVMPRRDFGRARLLD